MSQIFLPLRSNTAWFSTVHARTALERRLKTYILLYDEVVLQDGRYICHVTENGYNEWMLGRVAAAAAGLDRTKIDYFEPGQSVQLLVNDPEGGEAFELFGGDLVASYEVDFYPILHDAGMLGVNYVGALADDATSNEKNVARGLASNDRRRVELMDSLVGNEYHKGTVVNAFYTDSLLADRLQLPFAVDEHVAPLADRKRSELRQSLSYELSPALYNGWVELEFPDYSTATWEDVCAVRESAAGADFRRMVERVTAQVQSAIADNAEEREISRVLQREFTHEMARELTALRPSRTKAVLNLFANLIPMAGYLMAGVDVAEAVKGKRTWVSLLGEPQQAGDADTHARARSWF